MALTRDQLKALALAIEPVEPSNSYEFEYSIFHEDDIRFVCLTAVVLLTTECMISLVHQMFWSVRRE